MEPNSRLGSYTVLERLGAGGMGEVWLAHDPRLDRKVALKVLPASVGADPAAAARLESEARLLAQLDHPNVAGVYGLERVRVQGARTETICLVMQHVEGSSLHDRLAAGPLPLEEALAVARQIAAGVGAAHDRGIVHRDLKPANVMLCEGPAGEAEVKVLDFGLAKALLPEGDPRGDLSASPTMAGGTMAGAILGTAAYMSPEQARGKNVDRRTDVWAFGCVLYEMLTGDRTFGGDTVSDTLAKILRDTPDLDALPATTPRGVRRALRRCLEKNPERRPFDVRDVALDLVHDAPDDAAPGAVATGDASAPRATARSALLIAAGVAGGLLLGLLAAGGLGGRGSAADTGTIAAPDRYTQVTTLPGAEATPRLSADGEWIVYASQHDGDQDIYLQAVGGDNAINLTPDSPAADTAPALSPDGRRIAFRSERDGGGIFVMGRTGESVRRVTDQGNNPAWSPDGLHLAVTDEPIDETPLSRNHFSRLTIVTLEDGGRRELPVSDAAQPDWSPDGSRLVYWGLQPDSGQRDLWTIAVDGGEPIAVTEDAATDWTPVWGADGRSIYFSSDRTGTMGIWRIPVDPSTGAAAGEPTPVVSGGADWAAYPSLAADGTRLMYSLMRSSTQSYRVELSDDYRQAGEPLLLTPGSRRAIYPDISPDGRWVAFSTGETQAEDIWLQRIDGTGLRRLTNDPAKDRAPRFSPDGSRLAFYSDRSGRYRSWLVDVDGSNLRPVDVVEASSATRWSPDGNEIIGSTSTQIQPEFPMVRVRLDAEAGDTRVPLPDVDSPFFFSAWSPDGRRLAGSRPDYQSRPSGVLVLDLETGRLREIRDLGRDPEWLPDSRHVAVVVDDALWIVDVDGDEAWQVLSVAPGHFHEYITASRTEPTIAYSLHVHEDDVWIAEWDEPES